jgi:hypothetical protein
MHFQPFNYRRRAENRNSHSWCLQVVCKFYHKVYPIESHQSPKMEFVSHELIRILMLSSIFLCSTASKTLLNFIKTKSEKRIFSKKKKKSSWTNHTYERKLFFYTVTLQQEKELYVEKKMKNKITKLFFL